MNIQNIHQPKFFHPPQEMAPQPQAARESTNAAQQKIRRSQSRVQLSTQQLSTQHLEENFKFVVRVVKQNGRD